MNGVKAGYRGKEIDFLAINIGEEGHINRRIHVEVHASVSPLGPLRPWSPAKYGKMSLKERVKFYYYDKFVGPTIEGSGELVNRCVENKVIEKLGMKEYEKWLILGKLHRKDSKEELIEEFNKYDVRVLFLEDILKEIRFKGTARNRIGRFIQLLATTLTDEAKNNILKK